MVKPADLKLAPSDISEICSRVRLKSSSEADVDFFAAVAWSVICEPGDAFAGQLVSTFGAARALELELSQTSAASYATLFAEAGSDWLELQKLGRFERALVDARERWKPRFTTSKVSAASAVMAALKGWFITEQSEFWPASFNELMNHSPRGLWGLGNPERIAMPAVSVVGSRMATGYGEQVVGELLGGLISAGYSVVSGGAYGIDAHAHRAALAFGGVTVAVMAGGLDRLYPSGNRELFSEVVKGGAIISEMPPGAEPTKWRFLQRNRLIAALGQATILIEATSRSGAVSTANRAVELGKPVGAVPGQINLPGSDGCHQLIRDLRAQLITSSDDILELLGRSDFSPSEQSTGLGALETRVFDAIGHGSADVQKLSAVGGLTRLEIEIAIGSLSLMGLIQQDSLGWRRKL